MKLAFFGTGYVGLVTGTCFADLGNDVVCVDIDEAKVNLLKQAKSPIYEPGLEQMLKRNISEKRISFTTDIKSSVETCDILFICVGTPQGKNGEADLSQVKSVAAQIGTFMNGYKVIVNKSTVPVNTTLLVRDTVKDNCQEKFDFDVVSNPEFLKEGTAIRDFKIPDRIVIGVESDKAKKIMERLYYPFVRVNKPIVFVKPASAEIIKYGANGLLATKISFINMLSKLCEKTGADILEVARGIGLDERIGPRFLHAGIGYGGSCFPKDVRALAKVLEDYGCDNGILRAVDDINEKQKIFFFSKIKEQLAPLKGKCVAVWGLSYKPKTDDIREAPSNILIRFLLAQGVVVSVFDPEAMNNTKKKFSEVIFCSNPYEAVKDADALVICTEWDVFRQADKSRIFSLMKQSLVFDGRNIWDPDEMKQLGCRYFCVGRTV